MIVADGLCKYFGDTKAVDGVSFTVDEGENFVFLGTSGCGKTTTLKMINRLIEPTAGRVMVNGRDVMHQQPDTLRRSIGYVLQHNGLFPHYTVAENIAVVPRLVGMPEGQIKKRTAELLEKLHLPPGQYLNLYPAMLSGGQQQRVGLARALAADPPVLLMDEPFGALDTITRTAIRKELGELDEFKRQTILLVTHDVQEAFALADTICLMDKGKIAQTGKPAELIFRPADPFVAGFLHQDRMQLSLRSVKIEQVWKFLPHGATDQGKQAIEVSAGTSVWDIMEMIYAQQATAGPVLISLADTGTPGIRQAGFTELMHAAGELRKQVTAAQQ